MCLEKSERSGTTKKGVMTMREPTIKTLSRRNCLIGGIASSLTLFTPGLATAALAKRPRALSLNNIHTGERLKATYWENGAYLPDALAEINTLLRDFRTGEKHPIDTALLDMLAVLRHKLETNRPFRVISGYRSPKTNARLAAKSNGVARKSYHMRGMAIDVALADRPSADIHRAALALKAGGVGHYPKSGFVHVDVGPVRSW